MKNIRGINELIDYMRSDEVICRKINGNVEYLDRDTILNMPLRTILSMLDSCQIFIVGDEVFKELFLIKNCKN